MVCAYDKDCILHYIFEVPDNTFEGLNTTVNRG